MTDLMDLTEKTEKTEIRVEDSKKARKIKGGNFQFASNF